MKSIVLVACLLAVGLIAAGCGGDDETTTTTAGAGGASGATGVSGPLSKEEWITKADAICKQGDQEIDQEAQQVFGGDQQPSQEEQEQFVTETALPNTQEQIDQIEALPPPEGDEDQVNAILDAAQSGIDETKADPSLLREGGGGADPFAEANKLAADYGLKVCGQG